MCVPRYNFTFNLSHALIPLRLADARRVLWEECELDSSTKGGPVSHALFWAMVGLYKLNPVAT